MTNFFSTGEVAEKMNVHPKTVNNWIQNGWLEAGRKGPSPKSPYRISQQQLEEFIKRHPEMVTAGNRN